ncbi:hypothetical protein BsWGS_24761 [Bradybaena similaris]
MAGWSGFTDDDLRKMRQPSHTDDSVAANKKANIRKQQLQQQGKVMRSPRLNINPEAISGKEDVTDRMKLSAKSPPHEGSSEENRPAAGPVTNALHGGKSNQVKRLHSDEAKGAIGEKSEDDKPESVTGSNESCISPSHQSQDGRSDIKELDEHEAMSVELGNVQKFQQRQKVIEEANKRKRALLAKAIDDRRKKAKAEAEKLMKVQQELNHLDSLLTADITIIRDRIEAASLEYMDAQKRYEKAEKEFVVAKMDLFSKCEAKEQLTEHLYTIIHQNEVRKAKKLVELMEKLAMEVTPEEMELTIPAIPQLTNFTAVSTLHDPHHIKVSSAIDSELSDISAPSIDEITRSENAQEGTEDALSSNSANALGSNHVSLEVTFDTAGHSPDSVSAVHNSEFVGKDSCTPQQQNGILQNHTASESNINNHPDITPKPTPGEALDNSNMPQNCCPPIAFKETKTETQISESASPVNTLHELTNVQENASNQMEPPVVSDAALPTSDGKKPEGTNPPEFQAPSSSISPVKGWTLPFS